MRAQAMFMQWKENREGPPRATEWGPDGNGRTGRDRHLVSFEGKKSDKAPVYALAAGDACPTCG